MERIKVDLRDVETDVEVISNTVQILIEDTLSSEDGISTITANEKAKSSFSNGQQIKALLSKTLTQDVKNIHSLGLAFSQFDEMMGKLNAMQK